MQRLKSTTAIAGAMCAMLAFKSEAAFAATLKYDIEADFTYNTEDPITPGADGSFSMTFSFDEGQLADDGTPEFTLFDIDSFMVSFNGGALDGVVFSSDDGDTGFMRQDARFGRRNGSVTIADAVDGGALSIRLIFQSTFTDAVSLAALDLGVFLGGSGYAGTSDPTSFFSEIALTSASVTEIDDMPEVPLPPAGALMALTLGGTALRNAAKKRRAAKRAAASKA